MKAQRFVAFWKVVGDIAELLHFLGQLSENTRQSLN
jgi:hypothetical protein